MKNIKQKFWLITVWSVVLFSLVRIYFVATDDFRLSNLKYEMPYHPEWEIDITADLSDQLDQLLKQKFTYIAKGAQSYVFESEDQKYVIKFFKFKHLKPSWIVLYLPPYPPFAYFQQKELSRKQRKLYEVFNGHKLAYDLLKNESGLFFLQLNPKPHMDPIYVSLIDKIGLEQRINLRDVVFIVQEKGTIFRKVLTELLQKNDIEGAKGRIRQIIELYRSEYSKGVFDHDHGVMRNVGFAGEKPLHMDVGKLMRDELMVQPEAQQADLIKVMASIEEWLQKNYPDHADELIGYMRNKANV